MSAPTGTKRLVVAQGVLGLGSYALLVAAGRAMDDEGFAAFAVFWSVVFSFGLGLYGPLELLLLRLAALRRASADHVEIPRLVGWYLWVGLAAASVAAAFLFGSFHGSTGGAALLSAAGFGYFLLLRTLAIQRGVAAGRGDYPRYARQVGTDGATRVVLAAVLLGLGASGPGIWAVAVGAAGFAGALAARRQHIGPVPREPGTAGAAEVRKSVGDVLTLTAGTTLSVILANTLPTAAVALGASGAGLAGFSAVALVSRIPLFFAGLGQAVVVPRVAGAQDDEPARRRAERRLLAVIGIGSAVTAGLVGILTQPVVAVAFPTGSQPSASVVWLLAMATGGLLFALIGQGVLLGTGRMKAVAVVWLCATASAILTVALSAGPPERRVALASATSALTACLVLIGAVVLPPWAGGRGPGRSPASNPTAG